MPMKKSIAKVFRKIDRHFSLIPCYLNSQNVQTVLQMFTKAEINFFKHVNFILKHHPTRSMEMKAAALNQAISNFSLL
ncbi:hypothetical protein C3K47_04195 [Solitalea longa]|uniref:Uncharacterized protein n=1 Tax=Solitalea longa TaxID=2079460 RepID=A0A2S5A910_9SPHI|nr:hypothetical protein C3K47_04195 [Solitalea longa]